MPRRRDPATPDAAGEPSDADEAVRAERERPLTRELVEFETSSEGIAGEGAGASGTLPGSVGGTTGNTDRAAGTQAPGATSPPIPGIDPAEARGLVGRFRRSEAELEEAGEEPETTSPNRSSPLEERFPEEADFND